MGNPQEHTRLRKPTAIIVYAQTDVGKIRQGNEDNFLVVETTSEELSELQDVREYSLTDKGLTLMVSDGMGGAAAGEVASELAVRTTLEEMPCDDPPSADVFVEKIVDSLKHANIVITRHGAEHPEMRGMGATATTAGILEDKVFVGQIGDSRAYLIRRDSIGQITKDQSFVNQLVEAGKITAEEAANHPRRNVILQALGNQQELNVVISRFTALSGDYLLLCSDGLSGMLSDEEIKAVILTADNLQSACQQLIRTANERGGTDNITVVLAQFVGEGEEASGGDTEIIFPNDDTVTISTRDSRSEVEEDYDDEEDEAQEQNGASEEDSSSDNEILEVGGDGDEHIPFLPDQAQLDGTILNEASGEIADPEQKNKSRRRVKKRIVRPDEEEDKSARIGNFIQKVAVLGIIALIIFSLFPCFKS